MWKMVDEEPDLSGFNLDFAMLCESPALVRWERDMMPHLRSHAVNPSLLLWAPVSSPLEQRAIGRELNSYTGARYPEAAHSGGLSQARGHASGMAVCYR
jgi:hypothetical protein